MTSHFKDPYEPISIRECHKGFSCSFVHHQLMEVPAKLRDTKKYPQISKSPVISEMFSNCSYVLVCHFGRGASPLHMKGEKKLPENAL